MQITPELCRAVRGYLDMTPEQFGAECDLGRRTVMAFENGETVHPGTVQAIHSTAERLGFFPLADGGMARTRPKVQQQRLGDVERALLAAVCQCSHMVADLTFRLEQNEVIGCKPDSRPYRIERLLGDDHNDIADFLNVSSKIFSRGYENLYGRTILDHIEPALPLSDCQFALNIMGVYYRIQQHLPDHRESCEPEEYERLVDRAKFPGFDFNEPLECRLASLAEDYIAITKSFDGFELREHDMNSHCPMTRTYRIQLRAYNQMLHQRSMTDMKPFTIEEIRSVLDPTDLYPAES